MRKGLLLAIGLLGVASWVTLPAAQAATTNQKAELTGAEEVPGPGDPDGKGTATVVIDDAANTVCHELTYSGIGKVTAAHIHTGAKGVAGPPAVTLKGDKGCTDVNPTTVKAVRDDPGSHYVNIHTEEYKNGAIRGQLTKA
jgi:CHRD domain